MKFLRRLSIYDHEVAFWYAAEVDGESVFAVQVVDEVERYLAEDVRVLLALRHPGLLRVRRIDGCTAILDGFDGATVGQVWSKLDLDDDDRQFIAAFIVSQIAKATIELESRSLPLHLMTGTVLVNGQGVVRLVPPFHNLYEWARIDCSGCCYDLGFPLHNETKVFQLGSALYKLASSPDLSWSISDLDGWTTRARMTQGVLQKIISRCIEPEPDNRFDSISKLDKELDKLLQTHPYRSRPRPTPGLLDQLNQAVSEAVNKEKLNSTEYGRWVD